MRRSRHNEEENPGGNALCRAAGSRAEAGEVQTPYHSVLRSTIYTLITVAAIAVLVATLWLPVLQIYGSSMTPTLQDGEIIFSVKTADLEPGDIVAFYYNNKILVKRVICGPGDWVNIDEDGTVYVNEVRLKEPYLAEKALGDCNIELPYQVPDGKIFVMGDHRSTSVDSRNTAVGCVAQEQIVGKIIFRIWPLNRLGDVD
ncbi:MAG: signal peptidase I [Neglectibacter timonensis]